jgi:hypothetical protein
VGKGGTGWKRKEEEGEKEEEVEKEEEAACPKR